MWVSIAGAVTGVLRPIPEVASAGRVFDTTASHCCITATIVVSKRLISYIRPPGHRFAPYANLFSCKRLHSPSRRSWVPVLVARPLRH